MSDEPAARVADALARRGLGTPGRLLADAHRPLAPLLTDLGVAIGPLARGLGTSAGEIAGLLEDERGLDRVVAAIDATGDRRAEPR